MLSDKLQEYMEERDLSVVDLEDKTRIGRAELYRYIKGKKLPDSEKEIKRIADGLNLNNKEYESFLEEWDKEIFGADKFYSYKYLKEMVEALANPGQGFNEKLWKSEVVNLPDKEIISLSGSEEIFLCIADVLSHAGKEGLKKPLLLRMQPDYETIQQAVESFFIKSGAKIQQLVCMEQNPREGYNNLKIYKHVIPLAFYMEEYEVYYYYDYLSSQFNQMSTMPNFILMDDIVVQFDYEMKSGLLIRNPDYVEMMRHQWEVLKGYARPLFLRERAGDLVSSKYAFTWGLRRKEMNFLCFQPCMAEALDRRIYGQYLYEVPRKQEFIEAVIKEYGEWSGDTFIEPENKGEKGGIFHYISKEGIKNWMETGRLADFPEEFYGQVSLADRMLALKRVMHLVKTGIREIRIADIGISPNLILAWNTHARESYVCNNSGFCFTCLRIENYDFYTAMEGFLTYMEKKGRIYSREKTVLEMEKVLREYE